MLILDESGNVVLNPDLDTGYLEDRGRNVIHRYVIDVEGESHEEIIAEYPETGGKLVDIIIDVEEQGHWETRLETGEVVEFDGIIPDDFPHELERPDVQPYMLWRPYTAEQLAEIARQEEERARSEHAAEEREEFLVSAPDRVEATEAGVDASMDALAEIGALVDDNTVTLEDILNAVAELGVLIESKGV